jgi:hypothetical protein
MGLSDRIDLAKKIAAILGFVGTFLGGVAALLQTFMPIVHKGFGL